MEENKLLKNMLVEMLKWFHCFCVDNNIKYYILGGTMLGAARHKGFIPWDDDIDVGIPRDDYERFISLMKNDENHRYVLETPNSKNLDYYYPFSKLYDSNTTLIENTKYKIKRGIYLDIFPLDGVGDNYEESLRFAKTVYRYDNLLMLKTSGIRKGRKLYKNIAVIIFRLIPLNPKKILEKIIYKSKIKQYNECTWIANLLGAWREKEIMPKCYLGEPKLYQFENIEVFGVECEDKYLTSLYGEWRKLPPLDKRKSHHDFIELDLHKSYMENENENINH